MNDFADDGRTRHGQLALLCFYVAAAGIFLHGAAYAYGLLSDIGIFTDIRLNISATTLRNTVRKIATRNPVQVDMQRAALFMIFGGTAVLFLRRPARPLPFIFTALWSVVLFYSFTLATRNLEPQHWVTSAIYTLGAPLFTVVNILVFYLGADDDWWPYVRRLILAAAVVAAAMIFINMLLYRPANRPAAYSCLWLYEQILEACGVLAFAWYRNRFKFSRLVWMFLLAYFLATLLMQTRLMLVMIVVTVLVYCIVEIIQDRMRLADFLFWLFIATILTALAVVGLSAFASANPNSFISQSITSFWERRFEDSRTDQFFYLFRRVSLEDLLYGVGVVRPGEMEFTGAKGMDIGYVNIAYVGGLPLVVMYLAAYILPAVAALRRRLDPEDAACVVLVLVYGLELFSSVVPILDIHHFLLFLIMGRCAHLAFYKPPRKFSSGAREFKDLARGVLAGADD